jgi:hypothetical protein
MMKVHHQGAIDMAQAELASGKDPQLRGMAQNIISAQKKEIKEFDDWMKKASGECFKRNAQVTPAQRMSSCECCEPAAARRPIPRARE